MDPSIASRVITIPAHDDTPATPEAVSYITVEVADSGTRGSTLKVSWHDPKECPVEYEVSLHQPRRPDGGLVDELGRTANSNTQSTASKDLLYSGGQHKVRVYCGNSRTVGEIFLPFSTENLVSRPVPGTYSSEPALTGRTVSPGTLGPSFVNYGFLYSVLDVPSGDNQITLNATARDGYSISWYPSQDADASTAGQQVNLSEGYNSVLIWVVHDQGLNVLQLQIRRG